MCNKCGQKKCCCEPVCKPTAPQCKVYTSQIEYDGPNIDEACIRNGDNLNTVLENIGAVLRSVYNKALQNQTESFVGPSNIRLKYDPVRIIHVTYCGFIMPQENWKSKGKSVILDPRLCENEFADIQVEYTSKFQNDFNSKCFS